MHFHSNVIIGIGRKRRHHFLSRQLTVDAILPRIVVTFPPAEATSARGAVVLISEGTRTLNDADALLLITASIIDVVLV